MREEFHRIVKAGGVPGTLQLLDPAGTIKDQFGTMANSEMRRAYEPATSKPYEPTVIERGSPPLDLSAFVDRIKAFPEVDPDEEQRMLKEIEEAGDDETRARLKRELRDMFDKAAAEQRKYERPRQTLVSLVAGRCLQEMSDKGMLTAKQSAPETPKPQPQPQPQPQPVQSQPAPTVEPPPQPVRVTVEAPKPVQPETAQETKGIPIIAFGQTMLRLLGGLEHEQQRVKMIRRKFLLEVAKQVAMGANLSAQTVIKSFIKVKAATKP